jgi:hypothetical protein
MFKKSITAQNLPYFVLLSIFLELNVSYLGILCNPLLYFQHEKHTTKTACINGHPDDEHMNFETRRRHQELN